MPLSRHKKALKKHFPSRAILLRNHFGENNTLRPSPKVMKIVLSRRLCASALYTAMSHDPLNGKPILDRFSQSFESFHTLAALPKSVVPYIGAVAILIIIVFAALYNSFVTNSASVIQTNLRQNTFIVSSNLELELFSMEGAIGKLIADLDKKGQTYEKVEKAVQPFFEQFPEAVTVRLLDANRNILASWINDRHRSNEKLLTFSYKDYPKQLCETIETAFKTGKTVYSSYWIEPGNWSPPSVALVLPFKSAGGHDLAVLVRISLTELLEKSLPKPKKPDYEFSIVHGEELIAGIASFNAEEDHSIPSVVMPVPPLPTTMQLFGAKMLDAPLIFSSPLMLCLSGIILLLLASLFILSINIEQQRRKLYEAENENRMRRSMEYSTTFGIIVTDLDFKAVYCNAAVFKLTGYSDQELINKPQPWPFMADRFLTEEEFSADADKLDLRFDVDITHKNESLLNCIFTASPFYNEERKQIGWLCTLHNNDEAAKGQFLLNDSLKSYRKLINSVNSCISLLHHSPSGGILGIRNKLYTDQLGNTIDGHLAVSRAFTVPFDASGSRHEVLWVPNLKRWFDVVETRVRLTEGSLVTMQVALDVTAAKIAEDSLEKQAGKMEVSARLISLGEMASTITHEINQPLTAISTYSNTMLEVVRNNPESIGLDRVEEVLTKISTQAERIKRIIQNIRNFSQKKAAVQTEVSVQSLVNDIMELAQMTEKRHRVKVITSIERDLPMVECDAMQIFQVVLNLIRNAADAINESGSKDRNIHFSVRYLPEKERVLFEVSDHGPGIPDSMKDGLWTPFFTTKSDGLGLGLSICRSIIESHSSRLLVRDNTPSGAVFYFELMLAKKEDEKKTAEEETDGA